VRNTSRRNKSLIRDKRENMSGWEAGIRTPIP